MSSPNKRLSDFLSSIEGKKACLENSKEIIEVLGGLVNILSTYNRKRLLTNKEEERCLSIFGLNIKEEEKELKKVIKQSNVDDDDIKVAMVVDIENELSPKEIEKRWKIEKKKEYSDQIILFLNVLWLKYSSEKEDIFQVFLLFREKHLKFGEAASFVGFSTFCNVLELCEKSNIKRVNDIQHKYIGKPAISARFKQLEMKLGGEVSLIECLLYIYGENMVDFIVLPRSPCDANLKLALKNQAKVKADGLKLSDERDALIIKMKTAKPMKKAQMDLDLQRLNNEIQKEGVNVRKANKKQDKLVATAKGALSAENMNGTDPTNWFSEKLGLLTGVRAKVDTPKPQGDYDGAGDFAKRQCGQCGKTAFGKIDNDDGNFYCNACWAEF